MSSVKLQAKPTFSDTFRAIFPGQYRSIVPQTNHRSVNYPPDHCYSYSLCQALGKDLTSKYPRIGPMTRSCSRWQKSRPQKVRTGPIQFFFPVTNKKRDSNFSAKEKIEIFVSEKRKVSETNFDRQSFFGEARKVFGKFDPCSKSKFFETLYHIL